MTGGWTTRASDLQANNSSSKWLSSDAENNKLLIHAERSTAEAIHFCVKGERINDTSA